MLSLFSCTVIKLCSSYSCQPGKQTSSSGMTSIFGHDASIHLFAPVESQILTATVIFFDDNLQHHGIFTAEFIQIMPGSCYVSHVLLKSAFFQVV